MHSAITGASRRLWPRAPSPGSTPIYITEYNTNWAFFQDCCKNNPTYAPLFNSLYLTDMLNSVYNGVPQMPAKVYYFAGSAYPYFCLIGVKDSNNDCLYSAGATPVPYPQYYAYDLLASPSYLGLSAGGHMAKTISTPTGGGGGLATTAFYTASQDAVVIINPSVDLVSADHGYVCESRIHFHSGNALQHCEWNQITSYQHLVCCSGSESDNHDRCAAVFGAGDFIEVGNFAGPPRRTSCPPGWAASLAVKGNLQVGGRSRVTI